MRKLVPKLFVSFSLPLAILISLLLGHYRTDPKTVLEVVLSAVFPHLIHSPPETVRVIVLLYRAPRAIAAAITGAVLAVSGAALQSMLRNPLVDTYILGIASGAGFGAALAIAFLPPTVPVELVAFCFSLIAFMLAFVLAWSWGRGGVIALVLSGVIVNAFFSAALALVKYLAPDPHRLASIVFWLMGDIGQAAFWYKIMRMLAISLPCILVIWFMRWRLNVLSLGDEEARALGVNPTVERGLLTAICALMTSATVAYTGIIGWVGLLVPHIVRLMLGTDNRVVVTYSIVFGATYMVLADDLARCLTSEELPIGVLTTIMGAPLYIYLLRRASGVWR